MTLLASLSQSAAALALLALAGTAFAQPAAPAADRAARVWAASCAACHGTEGRSASAMPTLAGRNADELLRALQELRAGQRPAATVMHQHAKGYTDDELRRIAAWFSVQAVK